MVKPTVENKMIINLPNALEACMPNVYADRIEWMCKNLHNREALIISVHPHNDRGTSVASAELAVLAGADKVEGTLFGNGERAGNLDIINFAFNIYSQGYCWYFLREWADKTITHAPIYCSVDLRDGNQALINPLTVGQKLEYFKALVKMGFKQIEVSYPSHDTWF